MRISTPAFLAFLGSAILFWLGLLWQYRSKWKNTVESLAKEIRIYNTRNGYKANVDKEDLARDYLLPFHNSSHKELVQKNNGNYESYQTGLQEAIDKPRIVWRLIFHFLACFTRLREFPISSPAASSQEPGTLAQL